MTFPDTPLDLRTELLLNGVWTNISAYTEHDTIDIGRGHPDESTTVSPSTLALTLTNSDFRFSSKNVLSPYYPNLMRNVQCRISIPSQFSYLRLETDRTSYIETPNAAALNITGDIDIRLDFRRSSDVLAALCNKSSGSQLSWLLEMFDGGNLVLFWWDSGSSLNTAESTAPIPPGRVAIRVTLQVSTGTVTFYTAPTISGAWTQLGNAIVTGATSLHGGTAPLVAGDNSATPNGAIYGFQLLNGIGGTVVASPDFTAQSAGTTSFSDAQGNTWTLQGHAEISDRNYRGHFEVPEWPQEQDPTNKTILVKAAGGGLLRRLGQRTNPVASVMYRQWTLASDAFLAAYWPMEDGANSSRFGSGNGGQAMYFGGGALPKLASNTDFACSSALPVINGAATSGVVTGGTWADNQAVFLMEAPQAGEINGAAIAQVSSTGTIATLLLSYWTASGGSLRLQGYSATGTQLFDSTVASGFNVNGAKLLTAISLQNAGGGNIGWSIQALAPGAGAAQSVSGTVSGTIGAVTRVQLNPYSTLGLTDTVLGHCAVLTQWHDLFTLTGYTNPAGQPTGALTAWAAEPAGQRIFRLCREEGIQCRTRGNLNTTPLMGQQTPQTVVQLLQECADADRGIWYETRQCLGWGYITRQALYNQAAQVTVDYNQDHLGMWAAPPTEDDQVIVNDATVSQTSGGSVARQFAAPGQPVTGGRLSTLAPPAGAGTYDQAYSLNLYNADDLDSAASWIVHAGTVDQPRFPGIVLDLANRDLASLFWAILDMEIGDRIVIANPPGEYGPDAISQIMQQVTETLWTRVLTIAICGVPEAPYEVAQCDEGWHVDTDGTILGSNATSAATALQFTSDPGVPIWTTAAADFPFTVTLAPSAGINGEVATVNDINGPPVNFLTGDNASFAATLGNWAAGLLCTVAHSTAQAHSGPGSMLMTATGSGTMTAVMCSAGNLATQGLACSPGDLINGAKWFRAGTVSRSCLVQVGFYTAGLSLISTASGATVTDVTTGWVKAVISGATAPATAAWCRLVDAVQSVAGAGEQHFSGDGYIGNQTAGGGDQTAVVTRGVNGVALAWPSGTAVNVYPPPIVAL